MFTTSEKAMLEVLGLDTNISELSAAEVSHNALRVKAMAEVLKTYEKQIRLRAFEVAEAEGQQDDKGSYLIKLEDGSSIKKEARTSVKINQEESVKLFQKRQLHKLLTPKFNNIEPKAILDELLLYNSKLVDDVEFEVSPQALEQAYLGERISEQELQDVTTREVTYAFKVAKKK